MRNNTIDCPASAQDLFPETQRTETGYREIMLSGLNGGDPNISFQHRNQAGAVVGNMEDIQRQGRGINLQPYARGTPLQTLDTYQLVAQ